MDMSLEFSDSFVTLQVKISSMHITCVQVDYINSASDYNYQGLLIFISNAALISQL